MEVQRGLFGEESNGQKRLFPVELVPVPGKREEVRESELERIEKTLAVRAAIIPGQRGLFQ